MQRGLRLRLPIRNLRSISGWRAGLNGISVPESELRNEFAENPDGSVGSSKAPGYVPEAIMSGDHKHDYSHIRVPVLAFVGYPELPQEQIEKNHLTNTADHIIVEAVFGTYVGMTKNRIKRINQAEGGARVVELWGANHFVFLSNEQDVIRDLTAFLRESHADKTNRPSLRLTIDIDTHPSNSLLFTTIYLVLHSIRNEALHRARSRDRRQVGSAAS